MATLVWAIVCQRIITDQQTNTVSYIDAIEGLQLRKLPGTSPPFSLGTLWERGDDDEELQIRFRVVRPGGEKGGEFVSNPTRLTRPHHRMNAVIGGLKADKPGRYEIRIDQRRGERWRKVASLPIDVSQLAAED